VHGSWNAAFEELKVGLTLDLSYVKARPQVAAGALSRARALSAHTGRRGLQVVLEIEQHLQLLKRQSRVRIEQWLRKLAEEVRLCARSHCVRCGPRAHACFL